MTSSRLLMYLLVVMLILVAKVSGSRVDDEYNNTNWELLENIANGIHSSGDKNIREWDLHLYLLWDIFRRSSKSQRPTVIMDINHELTQWEFINSRLDMVGVILFGPEKGRSILRSVRDPERVNDWQCIDYTWQLFLMQCGCLPKHCFRRVPFFANICNYAIDKTAIPEALNVACGRNKVDPSVINVNHPTLNRVTLAPLPDSSERCVRVSVEGVSRMKIWSFANVSRISLAPSPIEDSEWDDKAHICVHRDSSQGLCQCEKDDWRSLEDERWSFVVSPYEQIYVDVKFSHEITGHVHVSLKEVWQGWRYVLLAVGFLLLFLAPAISKRVHFYSSVHMTIGTIASRAIAVTCIFESSIDTLFATIAVVTCLALYFAIRFITYPVTSKKGKLKHFSCKETTKVRDVEYPSCQKKIYTIKGNMNGFDSEIDWDSLQEVVVFESAIW